MNVNDIIWTDKMRAVMRDESQILFLVGATGCSKSLVAGIKFNDWLFNAPEEETQFYIVFKDIGTGVRNFLQNNDTFYNMFSFMRDDYKASVVGGLQFRYKGKYGDKTVYLVGANDKQSWSKVLGSNPDGIWLEELSVLHIDLIRELMGRAFSRRCKLIATTNGGLPTQEFYTEFVNHAEVSDSEKAYCFCLPPKGKTNRLAVYEAAIEILAHLTLEGSSDKWRLSLGGIYAPKEGQETQSFSFKKPPALEAFLGRHPEIEEIEICTNSDFAGRWAAGHLAKAYQGKYRIVENLPGKDGCDYADLAKEKQEEQAARQRAAYSL